jgi:hypothetical protein
MHCAFLSDCKMMTGLRDEVIPLEEEAIRLHPHYSNIGFYYWRIGMVQLLQSRTDEAIVSFEKTASGNPEFFLGHARLAAAYGLNSETGCAARELAEARKPFGGRDPYITWMRTAVAPIPKLRDLFEATYFAGLRKAEMPEGRVGAP